MFVYNLLIYAYIRHYTFAVNDFLIALLQQYNRASWCKGPLLNSAMQDFHFENYDASESHKMFDCILLHIFYTYTPVCPGGSTRPTSPQKLISSSREVLNIFVLKLCIGKEGRAHTSTLITYHYMELHRRIVCTPEQFKPQHIFIKLTADRDGVLSQDR